MYFAYAAVVTFLVVYSEIAERDLLNVTFVNPTTRMEFKATTWMILMYLLNTKGYVVAICILASVMMCAILGFFVYHLILIGYGMTTNESIKWGSLRKFHNVLLDAHKKYSNCTPEELEEHRRKGKCAFKDGGENAPAASLADKVAQDLQNPVLVQPSKDFEVLGDCRLLVYGGIVAGQHRRCSKVPGAE